MAFNMLMSSHSERDLDNGAMIAKEYALSPPKPCLDVMPRWEDHPIGWRASNGFFNDYDVRQAAYWAIFAGAAGRTYGANPVWQMMMTGRPESADRARIGMSRWTIQGRGTCSR